ncbi:N-6 DNA methylase [Bacillus sp. S/N-304-OC-R1]|uniref:N-6 DNA methylase n=1 Tax=Bacillus sp. S/N-304-OC-R1 TaxID=2758034 RepID=UPI001C8DC811|nr:N-6 DNA methylase [Bacillus sp. S/N-304-OC-R1]MBY0124409.1 N-6 DNA methylase [Bacillus sp. S/N-304-OC-R1]
MTREKALIFNGELESQFSKKEVEGSFAVELFKLHALLFAMEHSKIQKELVEVAGREELRNNPVSVKDTLKKLYQKLEALEPALAGVFLTKSFNSFEENALYKMIVLFERYGLTKEEYRNKDAAVEFFDTLIEELFGGLKGFDFTPKGLIQLMVQSLKISGGTVYDSTAGISNIIVSAYDNAKEQGKEVSVFGQEINEELFIIGKLNLFLNNILPEKGDIKLGDTIREPKWLENDRIKQFDYVLTNYPFGVRDWGYEFAVNDPYGRFELYGVPSKSQGDYAFILHALASLVNTGKAAIVVPFGTLVRGATERKIRSILLKDDVIETIISLPTNLFSGTGIQVALLILNKNKTTDKKGKVQFINAEGDYERTRTQKFLQQEHISKIAASVEAYENKERYSRIVSINEIAENNFDLNPSLYFVNIELETELGKIVFNKRKYETETKSLVQLDKIAEIIRGVNLPSRRLMETPNGEVYPVIQIRDIEEGVINFSKVDKFPIQARDIDRITAKPGDILVSSRGTQQRIAIVPEYEGEFLVSNMFIIIRLSSNSEVSPYYIKRFLESPVGQYYFEVNQSGSVATVLTPNDIRSIELPLVSLEQQNEMVRQLEEADDLIRQAYENRKKQYLDAYLNLGFGAALQKN